MSTGIESWNQNLLEIGTMYPFPGTEVLWVIIGLATWIIWHVVQYKGENRLYEEEEKSFQDETRLQSAMKLSAAETLDEELKAHSDNLK
jgi:hypothetical protein